MDKISLYMPVPVAEWLQWLTRPYELGGACQNWVQISGGSVGGVPDHV